MFSLPPPPPCDPSFWTKYQEASNAIFAIANQTRGSSSAIASDRVQSVDSHIQSSSSVVAPRTSFIANLGPFDICCGRGRGVWKLPGNQRLRELIVKEYLDVYLQAATKMDKSLILDRIMDQVRDDWGARFVKQGHYWHLSGEDDSPIISNRPLLWYEISAEQAREKVGHTVRQIISHVTKKDQDHAAQLKEQSQPHKRRDPSCNLKQNDKETTTFLSQDNKNDRLQNLESSSSLRWSFVIENIDEVTGSQD